MVFRNVFCILLALHAVPEGCINVEDVSALLFCRDTPFIAQLLQESYFSNAAGSRIITNLKPEVRDNVYCFMYPEEYATRLKTTKATPKAARAACAMRKSLKTMTKRKMSRETLYLTNLIKCLSTLAMKIVVVETLLQEKEKFLIRLYSFCLFLYT